MLGADQKPNARPVEQDAVRPMPVAAFREQMDSLVKEYACLEEENRQLRAHLSKDAISAVGVVDVGRRPSRCTSQAEVASQNCHSTAPSDILSSAVQVEVELPDLYHHTLSPEGMHFAAPGATVTESGPDVQVLDTTIQTLSMVSQVQPPVDKPPAMENPWAFEETSSNGSSEVLKQAHSERIRRNSIEEYQRRPIFANAEDMKERVRKRLTKPNYNVLDYYKKEGFIQRIARHQIFETMTLVMIGLNALWIWIDTDYNERDLLTESHPVFQIAENIFCFFFFVEICIRFFSFEQKLNCFKDGWFLFDSFLVIIMVLETWVMAIVIRVTSSGDTSTNFGDTSILRIARLLRLMRMARVARVLRAMPELVILIKGIVAAARSVFFTLVLLFLLMYVFAIAFTQMLKQTDVGETYFKKVPKAMHTLWLRGTLLDEVVHVMADFEELEHSWVYVIILDVFILAAALTVMNMLVGVLCEVVSAVAASEREELNLGFVKSKVEKIFTEMGGSDSHQTKLISKQEFVTILDNREAVRAIEDLGVDVVGLIDFADIFFSSDSDDDHYSKELSFTEFMEAVVALRGSNTATVKDIIDLRKVVTNSMTKAEKQMREILTSVQMQQVQELRQSAGESQRRPSQELLLDRIYTNGAKKSNKKRVRRLSSEESGEMDDERLRRSADPSAKVSFAASDDDDDSDADDPTTPEPCTPVSAKKLPGMLWD